MKEGIPTQDNAEQELLSPEEMARQIDLIKRDIENGYDFGNIISDRFSGAVIKSPEVQHAAQEEMIRRLAGGYLGEALKIKNTFSLPEDVVQRAAQEGMIRCLADGCLDSALRIIKYTFSLPEDVVQRAAQEGMIRCLAGGYLDSALKIKNTFSLPESVIKSPEVQHAAQEEMIRRLAGGHLDNALEIKNTFSVSKETMRQIAQENGKLLLKHKDFFVGSVEPGDIERAYVNEREAIVTGNDAEVCANFEALEGMLGTERLKRFLLATPTFWDNPHDHLLFLGVLNSRSEEDQRNIKAIVFQPLFISGVDIELFGQALSSFDVNIYMQERGGVPFRTLNELKREVQMQKMNIHIPESASKKFEDAVRTLVVAPGVDVPFIREIIDEYEQQNPPRRESEVERTEEESEYKEPYGEYEFDERIGRAFQHVRRRPVVSVPEIRRDQYADDQDDEEGNSWNETPSSEFATKLIDIIEGRDAIDERQVIRPWETEVSFDPLHRVLLAAAGIRGFNEQSPKLYGLLRSNEDLAFVVDALRARDRAKIEELKARRDELKAKYPEKAGRYDVEFRTSTEKETVLKLASGDEPTALRLENRDAYASSITPEEWEELFARVAHAVRADEEVAASVEKVFATLTDDGRREMVESFVDVEADFFLETLKRIQGVSDSIVRERTEGGVALDREGRDAVVRETVRRVFSDETIDRPALTEFLLYLALNNRTRLDTSKKVLGAISSLFGSREGKKRYEEQAQAAGENNLAQAYLKGKMALEPQDEQLLRDTYSAAVKTSGTRSLGIEIAKKSDPRGWVCGDYTDCCMPFTSGKNQEYLLREDMSYFLVSRNDAAGSSDLIGQSVLVYGEDEKQITVAVDNIEIANRAVGRGERAVVAKAYDELKKHLIDTYSDRGKRLKVVIGTSYNDDGGLVTGACQLKPVDAKPLGGDMQYSDWYHHSSNYVLYDSEAKKSEQEYYGLSLDAWEVSRTRGYVARQFTDPNERMARERRIEDLLHKIGRGEDDGDGGLSFADNYSVALVRADKQVGYVIAADYLSDDDTDDLVHLEEMHLDAVLPESEKKEIFKQYLKDKKFKKNNDLDGLKVSKQFIADNPFALDVLKEIFTDAKDEKNGEVRWPALSRQ